MGETQGDNNAGGAVERVTIAEAATVLGCHPNTVRSRVKAGMYSAEKVLTENGPTWMIDRDSLTTTAPTTTSQQGVSGVPPVQQEALQELARQIVREAGLPQDPELEAKEKRKELLEAGREHWKAQIEFFKHTSTVSGAALVAVTAITGAFDPKDDTALLFLLEAASFFLLSAIFSLIYLLFASRYQASFSWGKMSTKPADDAPWHVRLANWNTRRAEQSHYTWQRFVVYFLFGLGLLTLVFAVGEIGRNAGGFR